MVSYYFKRISEIKRTKGPRFLAGKFLSFPLDLLSILYYSLTLDGKTRGSGAEALVSLIYEGCRGMLRPFQVRSEICELAGLVAAMKPSAILEIGTAAGGTLFLFSRLAAPDARIISVDLPWGKFGGGYYFWRIPLYRSFRGQSQRLNLLRADSHSQGTFERVDKLLDGRKLDFLFIDGDHTYEGVKRDFQMYSGLVKKGGAVAFHDIVEHPADESCGVHRFWREIKTGFPHRELIGDKDQKWAGIGVIFL